MGKKPSIEEVAEAIRAHASETSSNAIDMAHDMALMSLIRVLTEDQQKKFTTILMAYLSHAISQDEPYSDVPQADKLFKQTIQGQVDYYLKAALDS